MLAIVEWQIVFVYLNSIAVYPKTPDWHNNFFCICSHALTVQKLHLNSKYVTSSQTNLLPWKFCKFAAHWSCTVHSKHYTCTQYKYAFDKERNVSWPTLYIWLLFVSFCETCNTFTQLPWKRPTSHTWSLCYREKTALKVLSHIFITTRLHKLFNAKKRRTLNKIAYGRQVCYVFLQKYTWRFFAFIWL